ncbi:MAG: hypothetical protein IPH12_09120 [Saprospirales bacterium]|nr:hypothetical protein [Saprospirales bacterium]
MSDDVRKTATQIKVDYKELVKKASAKESAAVKKLFEFSRIVDGSEAIEHAVTCLEVIPLATDDVVANALVSLSPKLKKVLLSRLEQAQGRTQKTELKLPIQKWAPLTWEVLHNRPAVKPGAQLHTGKMRDQEAPASPDSEKAGAPRPNPRSSGRE